MDKSPNRIDDKEYMRKDPALKASNSKDSITSYGARSEETAPRLSVQLIDYSLQNVTLERNEKSPSIVSIDHGIQHNLSRRSFQKNNTANPQLKRSVSNSGVYNKPKIDNPNTNNNKPKMENTNKACNKNKPPSQTKECCLYNNGELQRHHEKAELHREMRFQHKQLLQQQELQIKQQRIMQKEHEKLAKLQQFQMKQLEQLKLRHEQEKERYVHRSRQQLFKEIQKDASPQNYSCSSENEQPPKEKQTCKRTQKNESPPISRSCPTGNDYKSQRNKCCGAKSPSAEENCKMADREKGKRNESERSSPTGTHLAFHDLEDDCNEPSEQSCSNAPSASNKPKKCKCDQRSTSECTRSQKTSKRNQRGKRQANKSPANGKQSCLDDDELSAKKCPCPIDLRKLTHQLNNNCTKGNPALPLLANAALPNSREEYEYLNRLCYVRSLFKVLDRLFVDNPTNTEEETEDATCCKETGNRSNKSQRSPRKSDKKRKSSRKSRDSSCDESSNDVRGMGAYKSCDVEPDPTLSELEAFQTHCMAYSTVDPENMSVNDLLLVCNLPNNSSQSEHSNGAYCTESAYSSGEICNVLSSEPNDCDTMEEPEDADCNDLNMESEFSVCEDNEDYDNISFAEYINCQPNKLNSANYVAYMKASSTNAPRLSNNGGPCDNPGPEKKKNCAQRDSRQEPPTIKVCPPEVKRANCKRVDESHLRRCGNDASQPGRRSSLKSSMNDKKDNGFKICVNLPSEDMKNESNSTKQLYRRNPGGYSGEYNIEDTMDSRNIQYLNVPSRRARSRTPQTILMNERYLEVESPRRKSNYSKESGPVRPVHARLRGSGTSENSNYPKPVASSINTATSEDERKEGARKGKCTHKGSFIVNNLKHCTCENCPRRQRNAPNSANQVIRGDKSFNVPNKYSDLDKFEQSSPKRSKSNETPQGRERNKKNASRGCCPKKSNQKMSKEKKKKSRKKLPADRESESDSSSVDTDRRRRNNKKESHKLGHSSRKNDKESKLNQPESRDKNAEKSRNDPKGKTSTNKANGAKNGKELKRNSKDGDDSNKLLSNQRATGKASQLSLGNREDENGPQYVVGPKTCCWEESRIDWLSNLEKGDNIENYRTRNNLPVECKTASECWNKMQTMNVASARSQSKYPPIYYCPNGCGRNFAEAPPSLNCCAALKMWFAHMFGCRIV